MEEENTDRRKDAGSRRADSGRRGLADRQQVFPGAKDPAEEPGCRETYKGWLMGIENVQQKKQREFIEDAPEVPEKKGLKKFDHPAYVRRQQIMEQWWFETRRDHAENRAEMDVDEQVRDHHQWTEEEVIDLEDRGQKATQFNVVLPVCQWISGTEKRTRTDGRVLPRDDSEGEAETAEAKTKLLKYLSDVNKESWEKSDAFYDAISVGVGWLDIGVCSDQTEEPIYIRHEPWRNVWYDALCKKRNLAKYGRYIFRARWIDLEYLLAIWPEQAQLLEEIAELADVYREDEEDGIYAAGYSSFHQPQFSEVERKVVRVVECWHRFPAKCQVMYGEGPLSGKVYKKHSEVHNWGVENQLVSLHDAIRDRVFLGLFVGGDDQTSQGTLLEYSDSPYDHDLFPLLPVWGHRDGKTGLPFGVVRGLRDIQQDMNKRWSKSLHILSTNQVFFEDGAVDDENEFYDELDRPDGKVKLRSGGLTKVEVKKDNVIARQHLDLMQMGRAYVNEVSGVTGENQGQETNATSGKAILARQSQGMTISTTLFDNLRYTMQLANELKLSLIEQYYDQPKKLRILGERDKTEWLELNTEDGKNVLTEHAADFVLDEQDFHATMRQAMFTSLLEMVSKLPPEVGLKMLDLVMEMSDLPNRKEMVKRIRQLTGVEDPDLEEDEEAMAAKQQQQEAQAQLQARATEAELRDKEATAAKKEAETLLTNVKAETTQLERVSAELGKKLEAFTKALSVAEQLQVNPSLGNAADAVIEDAMPVNEQPETEPYEGDMA